jgi:hypothetical protein
MSATMQRYKAIIIGLTLAAITSGAFALSRKTFVWNDINTREVIRWEGDTAIIQQGSSMQELACKVKLENPDVEFAINAFGVPKSWTTFSYQNEEELAKKQEELSKKASAHGIKMLEKGNKFSVDYDWVVNHSANPIYSVAKTIRSAARKKGYRSTRELIGAFASFVQSLEYRIPPNNRTNDEGEEILTAGAMMPLETLSNGWGDCDSKSMLFAALVKSINLADVCFIVMDEHLFAGVKIRPSQDDQTIRFNNKEWVLLELTDAWPIGRVPANHLNAVIHGKYKVVLIK